MQNFVELVGCKHGFHELHSSLFHPCWATSQANWLRFGGSPLLLSKVPQSCAQWTEILSMGSECSSHAGGKKQ